VVQTWRADDWSPMDPESTLVLAFHDVEGGARLDMVHAGVPESHADDLEEGWSDNYWKPWKKWLKEQKKGKTGVKRRA
jgi:activator of Hsp90 ATPase-like protein